MSIMETDARTEVPSRLSRWRAGGIRELIAIAWPLALSIMSANLMLFCDRLFLAHYSTEALNASVNSSVYFWILQMGTVAVACIAEVFVGQYNGAGRLRELGSPIWQMIYFSLLSIVLYLPAGLFGGPLLFGGSPHGNLASDYFGILSYCGPLFPLGAALASFYIARGRLVLIAVATVAANITNVLLDYLLIFGVEGWLAPMGIHGAAWATAGGQLVDVAILAACFLSKRNRETYGTGNWRWNGPLFWRSVRIGTPSSISMTVELLGWAILVHYVALKGEALLTVASVTQSILILFLFVSESIGKAVTTIAANAIGARQWHIVWRIFRSGLRLNLYLCALFAIPFLLMAEWMVEFFLPKGESAAFLESVRAISVRACLWLWLYCLVDGVKYTLIGLLTAAGDTRFVAVIGGLAMWLLAIVPTMVALSVYGMNFDAVWVISVIAISVMTVLYFWRLRQERWKKVQLAPALDSAVIE
jgi:multidrug resistance protein, MATE family